MDGGWQPETTVALVCVALLPPWVCVTELNLHSFWVVVLSLVVGVGIGCGVAGVRRGGRASRRVAGACLAVLILFGAGYVALVRLDPWLYP